MNLAWFLLFVSSILFLGSPATADVFEKLEYEKYAAVAEPHLTLRQILNKASTIRHDGQVYHAYTHWNVSWNFRWFEEANGSCRVTAATATTAGRIKLPEMIGGDTALRARFDRYLAALREHELGHFRVGTEAARETERRILQLEDADSCAKLESEAKKVARKTLEEYMEKEREYDVSTQYGKTQGAWLKQ